MTIEQNYNTQLNAINERHQNELLTFKKKFALANNDISVGDNINHDSKDYKVKEVEIFIKSHVGFPMCVYLCEELKTGKQRYIYQYNP